MRGNRRKLVRRHAGGNALGGCAREAARNIVAGRRPERAVGRPSLSWVVLLVAVLALVLASCTSPDLTAAGATGAQTQALPATVLGGGLDNPRGLAVTPDGAVLVAEAGTGGGACTDLGTPTVPFVVCLGDTGAITRIKGSEQTRIVTGLPSVSTPEGSLGPADVSVHGNGNTYAVIGLGGPPSIREAVYGAAGQDLGHVIRINQQRGTYVDVADVSAFEDNNPDAGDPTSEIDSDPYSVARIPGGLVVADAGGNDLLKVDARGNVSLLAVFHATMAPNPFDASAPDVPMQAVPTSVAVGPDGAYYVGMLTGFPFEPGAAVVYRVVEGQDPVVFADGFTNIIGLDFAPDGSLYVLEIAKNGLLNVNPADPSDPGNAGGLFRVHPDGTTEEVAVDGLILPGGIAFDRGGTAYISTCTVCTGAGQVISVHP